MLLATQAALIAGLLGLKNRENASAEKRAMAHLELASLLHYCQFNQLQTTSISFKRLQSHMSRNQVLVARTWKLEQLRASATFAIV